MPEMIATAYRIIQAHEPSSPGAEMLTFFNCGQDSGASQPHCHFQLVELTPTEGSAAAVPVENLLNRIERDGKEHGAYPGLYRLCAHAPCAVAALCRPAHAAS